VSFRLSCWLAECASKRGAFGRALALPLNSGVGWRRLVLPAVVEVALGGKVADLMALGKRVLQEQPFSQFLGAELLSFEQGRAVLGLAVRPEFLQQHGFVHGGIVSYLLDNAITFVGGSLLGPNVVTVEFKVNYLRPAKGERLVATATSESSGGRLAVCHCEVLAIEGGRESRCAVGQGTIAVLG
jgi:uncharacterized protein (TIGR00369 family)